MYLHAVGTCMPYRVMHGLHGCREKPSLAPRRACSDGRAPAAASHGDFFTWDFASWICDAAADALPAGTAAGEDFFLLVNDPLFLKFAIVLSRLRYFHCNSM